MVKFTGNCRVLPAFCPNMVEKYGKMCYIVIGMFKYL